jgi:hypothetical protein
MANLREGAKHGEPCPSARDASPIYLDVEGHCRKWRYLTEPQAFAD